MPICFFKNKDVFLYIFGSSWFFLTPTTSVTPTSSMLYMANGGKTHRLQNCFVVMLLLKLRYVFVDIPPSLSLMVNCCKTGLADCYICRSGIV